MSALVPNFKLSIVTINLNHAAGLERTIISVKNQTSLDKIEYIVIDGNSTDGSQEIAKKYAATINYYTSEKDQGIYQAMNKGIARANGEYLLFLNSGDTLYDHSVIQSFLTYEKQVPQQDVYYGRIAYANKNTRAAKHKIIPSMELFAIDSLPHPASFIAKKLFSEIGLYNENYKIISDWIFFFSAYIAQKKLHYIDLLVTIFEPGGVSSNHHVSYEEKLSFIKDFYPNFLIDFEYLNNMRYFRLSRLHNLIRRLLQK
ncbi:glycosyltransferase (plasmid) [Pedobacter sp. BS3]|uniref:glycosyltransferase family 2 protein n=1 Tax=Pedobacter sp. BS3 TaxID=2567937 RepID=UPI0011ED229D|nr:glycosyltransferase family 2 protein [Pedobacter sp. BS3]TZF86197.1 glycosyltransferase [Pedobacter sp. BS3]